MAIKKMSNVVNKTQDNQVVTAASTCIPSLRSVVRGCTFASDYFFGVC